MGFFYAANAAGRFAGRLPSSLLYAWAGLTACLLGSTLMLAACWALTLLLAARPHDAAAALPMRGRAHRNRGCTPMAINILTPPYSPPTR